MADNFSSVVDSAMTPPASSTGAPNFATAITTLPAEADKKFQAAFEEHKKAEQASLAKHDEMLSSTMKKYDDAMSKIGPVYDAKLQDVPDAPNQKMQDPTRVLGSLGTILAIFGSMKTRAPMTSALNSMAAAMKGFHQGDQEAIKLNTQKWQNDFKKALAQNQIEMQRYTQSLEKHKFNMEAAQADFRLFSIEDGNQAMHDAVERGDFQAQFAHINANLNSGMKAAETWAKMDATKQAHADAMVAHRDAAAATAANRDRTATDREQAQRDRLMEFDAVHGTNLAGIKAGGEASGPMVKDEKVVKEIDDLKEFVNKNPSVVGAVGWLRQPLESISGSISGNVPLIKDIPLPSGMKGMEPLHQEFTSKLAKLQLDMRDALIRGGKSAKWQMDYIDDIVRGRGLWDTKGGTDDALDMLRGLYGGAPPAGQSASGKITPAPPAGFVIQ